MREEEITQKFNTICEKCKDLVAVTEEHHVWYGDRGKEGCKRNLCPKHHLEITAVNTVAARAVNRELAQSERWLLYYFWIHGFEEAQNDERFLEFLAWRKTRGKFAQPAQGGTPVDD